MEKWMRFKSETELKKQLNKSEEILGTNLGLDNLKSNISVEEIKQKYPERYNVYLSILRSQNTPDREDIIDINDMSSWIVALNNLDKYVESHKVNEKERILRARQFTVFEDIRDSLEKGDKEGYVKLPTGVGKTVLFSQVIEALNLKTLVVVPSKILINQTGEKLEEFTNVEFGKYFQDIKDLSKNVTIITYPSLVLAMERGEINPKDYGVMILDEVHKGLGDKTGETIGKFDCVKLGFTATPQYSENKNVENILKNKIHEMTIIEGVREGLINRFKSVFAFTETDISKVPINRNNEYDESALEKAINIESRNLSAVQLYKEMFSGQSAIAYCSGVMHSNDLADLFNKNGIRAMAISGKTSKEERKLILDKFNNGEIKVLCNAKLLIEGFDEPRASVALNLHPTFSKVDAEQRAGRVLRLDKNNPEKWGYIVDFIDKNSQKNALTFPEIARTAEIEYQNPPEEFNIEAQKKIKSQLSEPQFNLKLPQPKIDGLKVIVGVEEIMSISKNFSDSRIELEEPPGGWLNANQVSKDNEINHQQVQKLAEKYRNNHTDWFGVYKSRSGNFEYYHPTLVEKIIKDYQPQKETEKPKPGWMSVKALTTKAGASYKTIEKEVNSYRKSNPEWFEMAKTNSHKITEHYAPELSNIIIEKMNSSKVPEGWYTPSTMRDMFHLSEVTIKNYIEEKGFRISNPEWFVNYRNDMGKTIEHYHPDLVNIIEKRFSRAEIKDAPPGWKTAGQIFHLYGYDQDTVKKRVENYRITNQNWFEIYKTKKGSSEYYHPDLIGKVFEWYKQREAIPTPPEGWMTAYSLSLELKRDTLKMKSFALHYRESHPEWFKEFRTGSMIAEFYHPDLVAQIKKDFYKK